MNNIKYFHGYPGRRNEFETCKVHGKNILISYSHGVKDLINYIKSNDITNSKIILISPYVFFKKSNLLNFVLNIPFIGTFILNLVKEKKINDFFIETSSPCLPSDIYLKEKVFYLKNIKRFLLEKENIKKTDLKYIKNALVIYGDNDKISKYIDQVKPLEEFNIKLVKIENGGHALIWNNQQEVYNIINKYIEV